MTATIAHGVLRPQLSVTENRRQPESCLTDMNTAVPRPTVFGRDDSVQICGDSAVLPPAVSLVIDAWQGKSM